MLLNVHDGVGANRTETIGPATVFGTPYLHPRTVRVQLVFAAQRWRHDLKVKVAVEHGQTFADLVISGAVCATEPEVEWDLFGALTLEIHQQAKGCAARADIVVELAHMGAVWALGVLLGVLLGA